MDSVACLKRVEKRRVREEKAAGVERVGGGLWRGGASVPAVLVL